MKNSKLAWGILALSAGLGLGACGGGDGGGGGTAATGAKSVTVGTISAFGSIYVNGCKYETDSADIYVEGYIGSEDDLSVGDVVEVTGPTNCTNATATSIKFADELEGVVDSVTEDGTGTVTSMVVMMQNVTVNSLTTFENDVVGSTLTLNDLDTLTNPVVEISGLGIGSGDIAATRIELKALTLADYLSDPDNYIEVKGVVSSHDGTAQFNIGSLVVDYGSHPAILDGMSQISDDLYVEVKATTYTSGQPLVAIEVELEDDGVIGYQGDHDEDFEIKGMLTAAYDSNTGIFGINDQKVLVTNDTDFQDEDDHSDLIINLISNNPSVGMIYLEVEGHFNADGVLLAKEVELVDEDVNDDSEVTGTIDNLIPGGGPSIGTIEIGTNTFQVTNNTIMEDETYSEARFNFTHLSTGQTVEVYYDPATFDAATGSYVAIKVERKSL